MHAQGFWQYLAVNCGLDLPAIIEATKANPVGDETVNEMPLR